MMIRFPLLFVLCLSPGGFGVALANNAQRPNVLFIAVDEEAEVTPP